MFPSMSLPGEHAQGNLPPLRDSRRNVSACPQGWAEHLLWDD
jgi:hypothetical protein